MSPSVFNPASVSALLSTAASLIGAMGAWVLGYAPDWEDVKPLAWVGFTAAVTAACSFTATLDVPVAVHAWTGRVQVLAIALHLAAWYAYIQQWGARRSSARRWALLAPLVAAGALSLVPGVVHVDAVTLRPVPWLDIVYRDPVVSTAGYAVYAVLAAYGLAGVAGIGLLGRRGLPFPRTHLAVAAVLLAMGAHDVIVVGLSAPTPQLLDFALYGPAVVIAAFTLRRVVETATDLRRLRTGLEMAVVERTAALQRSQAALAAAERLAALRQFSAGFAAGRETSSPPQLAAPRRARILVVDDDLQMLRALVKLISAEHEVNAATGVREALAELADRSFDLVLCEVTLPTGGAERFWQELLLGASDMQGRVVFMTGGVATPAARAFLARQPQPVLEKPFGLAELADVMERLGIAPPGGPSTSAQPPRLPETAIGKIRS